MFNKRKPLLFDDVASDEAKRARVEINIAARDTLLKAARIAVRGNADLARELQQEAASLRSLAITIPLDMIAAGL